MRRKLLALLVVLGLGWALVACHSPVVIFDTRETIDAAILYDSSAGSGYTRLNIGCQAVPGGTIYGRSGTFFKQTYQTNWSVRLNCYNWAPIIVKSVTSVEEWH